MDRRNPLDALEGELLALPATSLRSVNLDIPPAVILAVAVSLRTRALRPELVTSLGEAYVARADRLQLVANALLYAHARHLLFEGMHDLTALSAYVHDRRELLYAEIRSLVARRLVPDGVTAHLVRRRGNKIAVFDVVQLVSAFRARWHALEGKTALTLRDLDDAESAASQLTREASVQAYGRLSPAAELRTRAFTLFVATYEDLRRAIHFLRWHEGDADRIAPPLYTGGRRNG